MTPKLIIVAAPSGCGKSTLCDRLLAEYPELVYSVSCTTREPRGEEEDGVDYHFVTMERYRQLEAEDAFLEHAIVHGNGYGTLIAPVRHAFEMGCSVIMDIDVAGASQIRARVAALPEDDPLRNGIVDIFILPPSMEELRRRLVGRGEDTMDVIERRMENAVGEIARVDEFTHRVVNDDLGIAYKELSSILEREDAVNGLDNPSEEEDHCGCHHHHEGHEGGCGCHGHHDGHEGHCGCHHHEEGGCGCHGHHEGGHCGCHHHE